MKLAALLGIEFARPWAALALLVPLLVLLAARRRELPRSLFTGAFELWLRVGAARPDQAPAARRRVPLSAWLLAAGLGAAVLAWCGPRPAGGGAARAWRVVVDRSPSMYLELEGQTRLAAGARRARALLDATAPDAPALWIDASANPPESVLAAALPPAWEKAPRAPRATPAWTANDEPGTLWLSDDGRALAPGRASLVASGGPAVPGAIGRRDGLSIEWDGQRCVERPLDGRAPCCALDARLPAPLAQLARAWAAARGIAVGERSECELDVAGVAAGGEELEVSHEGWSARARVAAPAPLHDDAGALEPWLRAADGRTLVSWGPGRVRVAFSELAAPAGDPAAFAVSWGALFDQALLPAPGVVALSERAQAGEARMFLRAGPPPDPDVERRSAQMRALACALALALVLAACASAFPFARA